jgi:hypothetical protein
MGHQWLAANAPDDQRCPLCTWRGPVELVDGVCPQCGVNWPERYRDAMQAEQGQDKVDGMTFWSNKQERLNAEGES